MIQQVFPRFPTPGFSPNFTGYALDSIDWYTAHELMSQSPNDALFQVNINYRVYLYCASVYEVTVEVVMPTSITVLET